jgi:hypothetical protein
VPKCSFTDVRKLRVDDLDIEERGTIHFEIQEEKLYVVFQSPWCVHVREVRGPVHFHVGGNWQGEGGVSFLVGVDSYKRIHFTVEVADEKELDPKPVEIMKGPAITEPLFDLKAETCPTD